MRGTRKPGGTAPAVVGGGRRSSKRYSAAKRKALSSDLEARPSVHYALRVRVMLPLKRE